MAVYPSQAVRIPQPNLTATAALSLSTNPQENADKTGILSRETIINGLSSLEDWHTNPTIVAAIQHATKQIDSDIASSNNQKLIDTNRKRLMDQGILDSGLFTKPKKIIYSNNPKSTLMEEITDKKYQGLASPNLNRICDQVCHATSYGKDLLTEPHISYFELGTKDEKMSWAMEAEYIKNRRIDAVVSVSTHPDLVDLSQGSTVKAKFTRVLTNNRRSEKEPHQISITPAKGTHKQHSSNLSTMKTYLKDKDTTDVEKKNEILVFNTNIPHDAPFGQKLPVMISIAKIIHESHARGQEIRFMLTCNQTEAATITALTDLYGQMENYKKLSPNSSTRGKMIGDIIVETLRKTGATPTTLAAITDMTASLYYLTKLTKEESTHFFGESLHPSLLAPREVEGVLQELELKVSGKHLDKLESKFVVDLQKKLYEIKLEMKTTSLQNLPELAKRVELLKQNLDTSFPETPNMRDNAKASRKRIIDDFNKTASEINERSVSMKLRLNHLKLATIDPVKPLDSSSFAPLTEDLKRKISEIISNSRKALEAPIPSDGNYIEQKRILQSLIDDTLCTREFLYNNNEAAQYITGKRSHMQDLKQVEWEDLRDPLNTTESKKMFKEFNSRLNALNEKLEKVEAAENLAIATRETEARLAMLALESIEDESDLSTIDNLVQERGATAKPQNVYRL